MNKALGLLASLVLVSGCSSKPPVVMDEAGYNTFAYYWVVANRCLEQGDMRPELQAYGKKRMQQSIAGVVHDPAKINRMIEGYSELHPSIEVEKCRVQEAAFAGWRDEYDRNVRDSQNNSGGQQTYCYSGVVGTNCTTY
jgi:hypothetical protein